MQAAFEEFAGGNGTKQNDDFASIVTERHTSRLEALLTGHGGTIAFGGEVDPSVNHVEPTVIVDPDPASPVMQEEIFGPILPVITVESMEAAVDFVNARAKPLAMYVFADDDDRADQLLAATSSGGACVYQVIMHLTPAELPFGGVGASGIGRYHGQAGFDAFSNLRSVLKKPSRPDPKLLYPPYTSLKEKLIRRFI